MSEKLCKRDIANPSTNALNSPDDNGHRHCINNEKCVKILLKHGSEMGDAISSESTYDLMGPATEAVKQSGSELMATLLCLHYFSK